MALNAFAKFSASLFDQIIKGLKNKFKPKAKSDFEIHKVKQDSKNKVHPWRSCGVGQHWVTTHKMSVPFSSKNPAGLTTRHGHCANNPKRKNNSQVRDYLTSDEIHEIANQYFKDLSGPPTPGKLPFEDSDKYDELIRGWTQYWNDVFHPETPLDPDVVKALIASESSFELKPKEQSAGASGQAIGLIQLTEQAVKALGDPKGELKDHLVSLKQNDLLDPNLVICAGIRWLFHKRELAKRRLKRTASWEESVAEYKSYLKGILNKTNVNPKGMTNFKNYLKTLKQ